MNKRIDSIAELDLATLQPGDLKWQYGTGQAQPKGSGRGKTYSYRTGVQTPLGDIEISVWIEAAEYLIQREGLQTEMEHLAPFMPPIGLHSPQAKRDAYAHLMDACLSQLYCNPQWVCFTEYNQKYHPELLVQNKEKEVIPTKQENRTFALRPASHDEDGLFYSLPPERDAELGTIGHIRIDFGKSGEEFWHQWFPRGPEALNSLEFKKELDALVAELRKSVLKDMNGMVDYCWDHGTTLLNGRFHEHGFVAETDHYRYCLRCILRQGDYNAYLTCYDKRVQELAQKPLVGRLRYANGEVQEFTDPEKYIAAVKEELPYRSTTGMMHETLTDDPKVRKAIDDALHDLFGEENPRPLADYEDGSGQSAAMKMGGM